LEPERSKTGYSRDKFEINSTLFVRSDYGSIVRVPTVRIRALANPNGSFPNGSALKSFTSELYGTMKSRAEHFWFGFHRKPIERLLNAGVPLPSLGFSRFSIQRTGNFVLRSAKLCAKRLPLSSPLPTRKSVDPVPKRMMNDPPKVAVEKSATLDFIASFGRPRPFSESGPKLMRTLWRSLPRHTPHTPVYPSGFRYQKLYNFMLQNIGRRQRRLPTHQYFGKMFVSDAEISRLLLRKPPIDSRVAVASTIYQSLPAIERNRVDFLFGGLFKPTLPLGRTRPKSR
jgi:hypothetical protein